MTRECLFIVHEVNPVLISSIVQPGGPSQHMHSIVGGSNFDKTMSYESARKAKCSTAQVQEDKSNYWTPQLYYYNPNDTTFEAIPAAGVNTYYLPRAGKDGKVRAFPDGLRMVSGSPNRRTFNNDADSKAANYVCLDYSGSHHGDPDWDDRYSFFTHNCPNGMRAQIFFRSCWDGVNLDSSDHISHMAWPSGGVDGGECPDSHPVRLVSLFYEFIYNVQDFPFNDPQYPTWVFANGDTTGYGMHGDFLNGWPEYNNGTNILQQAIDGCNDNNGVGGELYNCPPLVPYLNSDAAASCQPENDLVNEDVGFGHALAKLPGDNPLWIGNTSKPSTAGYSDANTTFSNFQSTIPDGYSEVGCIAEGTSGRALTALSWTASNMTRGACVSYCQANGYPLAGIEYGSECYCDFAMRNGASNTTLLADTKCSSDCGGNDYEHCGGASVLSLFNNPSLYPSTALPAGWSSTGCYTELSSGRTLSSYSFSSNSMTRELCASTCLSKGYKIAGTEYARECYCSNSIAASSSLVDDSSCNMLCAGDKFHSCGGSSRLSVWTYSNSTTTSSTTAAASTSSKAANSTSVASSTAAKSTAANATVVVAVKSSSSAVTSSTISSTSVTSSAKSSSSSATKSSTSSSVVASTSTSASASTTSVSSTSTSTSSSASASVSLPTGWSNLATYTDSTAGRTLGGYQFSSSSMTQDLCVSTCNGKGYKYAGVEYASQCFCGDDILASASTTAAGNMACAGNSAQLCGGSGKINIFVNANAAAISGAPSGWTVNGCYPDSSSNRALDAYSFSSSSMTPALCTSTCLSKGYNYAGLEYGGECYCDTAITASLTAANSNNCEYICNGDSSSRCGGNYYISILVSNSASSNSTAKARRAYPPSRF